MNPLGLRGPGGNYVAALLAASLGALLTAGACHSSQRLSAPSPGKQADTNASAIAAPSVLAPIDAGTAAAGVAPWDGGGGQPLRVLRNHEAAQQVVESLLGEDLVYAKKVCSYEPPETKESCIDAALKVRTDELEAKMMRNARAFELLQKVGNEDCARVPRIPTSKKEACVLESTNRHLVERPLGSNQRSIGSSFMRPPTREVTHGFPPNVKRTMACVTAFRNFPLQIDHLCIDS